MKKGLTTLEFIIGLVFGIAILFALLYPSVAFTKLFFGSSQPCITEEAKNIVNRISQNIEGIQLNQESQDIIRLEEENCAFVLFSKVGDTKVIPPQEIFGKTAICVCEFKDNSCTENKYCTELKNIDSLTFIDSSNNYIGFDGNQLVPIYYKQQGTNVVFSRIPIDIKLAELNFSIPKETPSGVYSLALKDGDPYILAFMRAITVGEGTAKPTSKCPDPYRIKFGGECFTGDKHPDDCVPYKNTCSTAAGRYQFLSKTWMNWCVKYQVPCDQFTPINQDLVVYYELKARGLDKLLAAGDLNGALDKTKGTWASLPGSPYGQPTLTDIDFENIYNELLAEQQSSATAIA
ncbi:MAG: glycoside hydrolase family 104 protein [Candidatus Nanoarchaeia archaeon]|nr:glycoside hydrolase family 104 protein [Candidatus Nanoarchaeia archaeon]